MYLRFIRHCARAGRAPGQLKKGLLLRQAVAQCTSSTKLGKESGSSGKQMHGVAARVAWAPWALVPFLIDSRPCLWIRIAWSGPSESSRG